MRKAMRIMLAGVGMAALAAAFGAAQPQRAAPEATRTFEPYIQIVGHDSAEQEARFELITSQKQWQSVWAGHLGRPLSDFYSPPTRHKIPKVNFDRCMVIARFAGSSQNADGEIVDEVAEFDDRVRVRFTSSTFQTSSFDGRGGAVDTTPFGFWVLPRIDKPVVIEESRQRLKDAPVEWEEVHRFPAPHFP